MYKEKQAASHKNRGLFLFIYDQGRMSIAPVKSRMKVSIIQMSKNKRSNKMKRLQMGLRTIFLMVLLTAQLNLLPVQTVYASSLTVCPSGCTYTTVGAAVSAAIANDAITILAGTYHETNIDFSKNLTLKGVGSAQVIIDAQHNGRVFQIDSGKTVYMEGMTIQNGSVTTTDSDGGAIFSQGNLVLDDLKFLNNHADDMGGAIFSEGGSLTITNSTFSGNNNNTARATGASGGAIASASIGSLSLQHVTFTNNTAKYGGAIATLAYGYIAGKKFTITNSTFTGNTATQQGGAIFGEQIDTTITNSLINDNGATSSFGGGMYFSDIHSTLTIQNVTISHNHGLNGGGLYFSPTLAITLNGVTVTLNNSTDAIGNGGGGIYAAPAIPLTIKNSIIAGNTDTPGGTAHPDCDLSAASITYSLLGNVTGCAATTFSNNLTGVSAKLDVLANYGGPTLTHRLQGTSPAIDSGNNTTCPTMDQRGVLRPKDGNNDNVAVCDMGAYEVRLNQTANIPSTAAQDGWVLESTETSNVGGLISGNGLINLGDNAAKQQYRSILSFNTSNLPDAAVITGVTLQLKKQGVVGGGDPVATFQGFLIDIKTGFFGTAASLQAADFQAAPVNKTLGPASPGLVSGFYNFNLTNGKDYINKLATNGGLTQIRLHFKLDDNNDAVANILSVYSGETTTAADRPQLVVTYYLP